MTDGSSKNILDVILVSVAAYFFLVFFLRITGKRTLSKLNSFDFIVTVALGSTLATTILSQNTPLRQGLVALALLVVLQLIITWLSARFNSVQDLVKATPSLIFRDGKFLEEEMKRVRVSRSEILAAMRERGIGSYEKVGAVVLETNGELSVIESVSKENSTLESVGNWDAD